jgi:hypothetical protein
MSSAREADNEIDCDEWLELLNKEHDLIEKMSTSLSDKQAEKHTHDASVDLFCMVCSDHCDQAKRFDKVVVH